MKQVVLFVFLAAALMGCSTTPNYVTPATAEDSATYRVEGGEAKVSRRQVKVQERTNEVLGLMDEAREGSAINQKGLEAINNDMVLAPIAKSSVINDGPYPVALENRHQSQSRTFIIRHQSPGATKYTTELVGPGEILKIYGRAGNYEVTTLDRYGKALITQRLPELDPKTGREIHFLPKTVQTFPVPEEHFIGGETYYGKFSTN